jgi:hypothetical protein
LHRLIARGVVVEDLDVSGSNQCSEETSSTLNLTGGAVASLVTQQLS